MSSRKSTRSTNKPERFTDEVFEKNDHYDRCLGGYKWVSRHKDHKTRLPKRNLRELQDERDLVKEIEEEVSTTITHVTKTKEGYLNDGFVVEDDDY